MTREYAAPADRVFEAFTSEEVMRRWWHAGSDWETATAEVDLRVGGAVRVVMGPPGEGERYGGGGSYTVVDPPRRLAFTWEWDNESWTSEIDISFEDAGGKTRVVFVHSGLPDEESVRSHEGGWGEAFANLGKELEAA